MSGVMITAVVLPVFGPLRSDSFPLSTYPMFSSPRPPVATVSHVVGVDDEGVRRPLAPKRLGTDEVMQAMMTVRRAVDAGPLALDELCLATADRLTGSERRTFERLEVSTDRFDVIGYAAGRRSPESVVVHASCPVPDPIGGSR